MVVATVALTATSASATHNGANGKITYNIGNTTYVANPDGSAATILVNDSFTGGTWAPDGSRFAYSSTAAGVGIKTVRQNGVAPVVVTGNDADQDPAWGADGDVVFFSRQGRLWFALSDGAGEAPFGAAGFQDVHPSVYGYDVIFERDGSGGAPAVYRHNNGNPGTDALLIPNAAKPDYSPEGERIAYVVPGATAADDQIWIADAAGENAVKLTNDAAGATSPAWSPDGNTIIYTQSTGAVKSVVVANPGTVSPVNSNGQRPAWQSLQTNGVDRVWGQDAIETAISASQWNYADFGADDPIRKSAGAVVLSRSDQFYDALAGSALAISKDAPLLITATSALDARVQAEIKRVLGTSGTVYLLGGTAALPASIANKLTSLGYTVQRLWGNTAVETAIAINRVITDTPEIAIVATGAEFYDALAAGAVAGANSKTVIVLSWGSSMPAASANYLNSLNPDPSVEGGTLIVAAGGPGEDALVAAHESGQMPNWPFQTGYYPVVGDNAKDTALLIAQSFFASPLVAAVATSAGWYDALTGGAMIGAQYGPLLLTDPNGLYGPVADYLSNNSANIWKGVVLGGEAALPASLISPIGNAIAVPGWWQSNSIQPNLGTPGTKSLQAQTTPGVQAGKGASGRPAVPGVTLPSPTGTLTR
ncbi:cell wall-binding repeat-containing protein [Dactylosporangium sp. NBC_01737]|uniref:cell wall-binding repeat-containing protein n=1 Tax=Dactylosporangium sp. NBC_01737 TaxID=2975959 RepID=UPI002E13E569|nr:cell wall-binding repeat-containing protein [Dactylosporangium sp. NBC_01737]